MKAFSVWSYSSCVSALLLPSVLGAAINHGARSTVEAELTPSSSDTDFSLAFANVTADPEASTYTNLNSSALDAVKPTVMVNLRRGSNFIQKNFEGAALAWIEVGTSVGGGVPRDQPEKLTKIRMHFQTSTLDEWGEIDSNPDRWGQWGLPMLGGRVHERSVLWDIPSLRVPLPDAIAAINEVLYPGNLYYYWINNSGRGQPLAYKFHIGSWLFTVDALTGEITGVIRWPPGGGSIDRLSGEQNLSATS